ncbi:Y-family DNA polymerase [Stutzerimonas stutzeri]|uniref:Translesion error-prone DNA polymerase V subunit UmuC n=1 Tax=Stutzerimonas stutzeri TaxID=316 RepID=A0A6I6LLW0_STUST|nr:Y-family DNA polymerase [Stutzerimonas stutzeri]QGZ31478.1 translesion error-prone DNA polymerase V subunit UmuC [Stutzerimonas stutzeri]
MPIFALIDCNSFYCSCERICQPSLKRKPVVVLSNNDGCVIARTSEVKQLGIPMGAPFFQVRDQLAAAGVVVRSSNYTLYADISNRVMTVLASMLPAIEVYSIDEAWGDMTGVQEDLTEYGKRIRARLLQWVGMPVGVGISTTKTLAKLANWAAKKWPATGGVVDLTDPARQERLLRIAAVSEVWGVGRRLAARLRPLGIKTAWDLAQYDIGTLRKTFGVTLERTARELRGISCIGMNEGPPPKQAICSSKMFGRKLRDLAPIQEAMATYVTRAAEKLRQQQSLCGALQVSLQTQYHNPELPRYANCITCPLATPTDDTRELLAVALRGLRHIYRPGYAYSKCAVLLIDLSQRGETTPDLFAPPPRRGAERLMSVVDEINKREGRGTVRLGRVPAQPEWGMRRDMKSLCYTTNWDELIIVGA